MQERLEVTGKGTYTVYVDDKALHSRYDPAGEAEKYLNTLDLHDGIRRFILIEPGLGYFIPALERKFPQAEIIALHLSDFFVSKDIPGIVNPRRVWSPGLGTLQHFLEITLPDMEASKVKVIEWRPALAAYGGGSYFSVLTETLEFIKRIDANARTLKGFGRRWLKNFFKNLRILDRTFQFSPEIPRDIPWIITGAGPSLEGALPKIRDLEKSGIILASASSVPALAAGGVTPDLILATDGGSWALLHLFEAARVFSPNRWPSPILMFTMNAAIPSQYGKAPLMPIADNSLWQRIVLSNLDIPFINLPQRGTVTAAALDIASAFTDQGILLSGLDLENRDLKTHAHPYSFNRLQEESAKRLNPRYSQSFRRSRLLTGSGSAAIYREWFKRRLGEEKTPLYSLGNNHPLFKAFLAKTPLSAPRAVKDFGAYGVIRRVASENRVDLALHILRNCLDSPRFGAGILAELASLLTMEGTEKNREAIMGEIEALAGPYEGE